MTRPGSTLWSQSKPEWLARGRRIDSDFKQRTAVAISPAGEAGIDRRDDAPEASTALGATLRTPAPSETQRFEKRTWAPPKTPKLDGQKDSTDR